MNIRADQMNALSQSVHERFARSLVPHLRARYGPRLARVTDADLVRLGLRAVDEGARYGIRRDYDIRRYAEYMVEFLPGFDVKQPWAARILNGTETGTEKMDALDAFTTFELRSAR